jgi:hypothetical protein
MENENKSKGCADKESDLIRKKKRSHLCEPSHSPHLKTPEGREKFVSRRPHGLAVCQCEKPLCIGFNVVPSIASIVEG